MRDRDYVTRTTDGEIKKVESSADRINSQEVTTNPPDVTAYENKHAASNGPPLTPDIGPNLCTAKRWSASHQFTPASALRCPNVPTEQIRSLALDPFTC